MSSPTTNASNIKRKDASTTLNGNTVVAAEPVPHSKEEQERRDKECEDRNSLVLWRRPLKTLEYSARQFYMLLCTYGYSLLANKKLVSMFLISVLSVYILVNTNGPHHNPVQKVYKTLLWCLYWIGLGILSSVGLGTGLHTFILYLGPHIARVTLAAYECDALNFPEPPYPDDIICPTESDGIAVNIFSIMSKVRLEAMCWGAGTALGELPPYFMAKASRLSGIDPDEEEDSDLKAFEELQRKQSNKEHLSLIEKGKLFVEGLVQKVGFLGILACASIPNPLFDLAGITCGHFLVPFWTFFGATLLGKAVIKMHIQQLFVIIAFNETLIGTALSWLEIVPFVGKKLQEPFKAFLDTQKVKLHKGSSANIPDGGNIIGKLFEMLVIGMVLYFVVSLINASAQSYHKRIHKKKNVKASKD